MLRFNSLKKGLIMRNLNNSPSNQVQGKNVFMCWKRRSLDTVTLEENVDEVDGMVRQSARR